MTKWRNDIDSNMESEGAPPLSSAQLIKLFSLLKDRHHIIQDRSIGAAVIEKKRKALDEVTEDFNASNPDQHPRSI